MLTHYYPASCGVDLPRWLAEAARQLPPGGQVSLCDWVVPGSRLRGKKAAAQRQAGAYVNVLLQWGRPAHGRALSQAEWEAALQQAGFVVTYGRCRRRRFHLDAWSARLALARADRLRLQALLVQAPAPVLDYLTPQMTGDRIAFHLQEILIIGTKV